MTTETMSRTAHRDNVLNWLLEQFPSGIGALTGTDCDVICAAEAVANLWLRTRSEGVAYAFAACVQEMQPKCRYFAFELVAFQGDWSHREDLWEAARLTRLPLTPPSVWSPEGRRAALMARQRGPHAT